MHRLPVAPASHVAMRDRGIPLELTLLCLFSLDMSRSIVPSIAALGCVVLGDSDTKMQRAKVFGLVAWCLAL